MNPSSLVEHFEGPVGALIVSVTAFTIVFVVLAGLTAVIYAIKMFSSEPAKPAAAPMSSALEKTVAPNAPALSVAVPQPDQGRITAVITAAILVATHGRGKIVSVMPEIFGARPEWTRTWKISGRVERLSSRLVRTWKN